MDIIYDDKIQTGDVIAVGDIHGTWTLFKKLLDWVQGSGATLVLLGDLIDRGGEDLKVLNAVKKLLDDPQSLGLESTHVLMGNHEKMFLDSFGDWGEGLRLLGSAAVWFGNGGSREHCEEMARDHYDWVRNLPVLLTIGDTLFVHGGIYPGSDPRDELQQYRAAETFLWMRQPFLREGPKFESWSSPFKRVVHGHTPTFFETGSFETIPVVKEDRVNIDTGAFIHSEKEKLNGKTSAIHGRLTAFNVTQNTFQQFAR